MDYITPTQRKAIKEIEDKIKKIKDGSLLRFEGSNYIIVNKQIFQYISWSKGDAFEVNIGDESFRLPSIQHTDDIANFIYEKMKIYATDLYKTWVQDIEIDDEIQEKK